MGGQYQYTGYNWFILDPIITNFGRPFMELFIQLNRSRRAPLSIQIAHGIRDAIFNQRLQPGAKLPPTRDLAHQLKVSRTIVIEAYEWLVSEGYAEARQGSGTYLSEAVAMIPGVPSPAPPPRRRTDESIDAQISYDFRPGLPALDLFPRVQWKTALTRALLNSEADSLGYGPVEGLPKLRRAIAEYVGRTRGLPVDPDRVVITIGVSQALDLMLRTLAPIPAIAFEEPSAEPVGRLIRLHNIPALPVPVDRNGMQIETLSNFNNPPTVIHVVPSHQFPTGVVMSLERRLNLLAWAKNHNAVIIEDDYDSEFRFDRSPPIALAALDSSQRVVYFGTFSKTLYPGLRLGFCVLPERLMKRFLELKWFSDRCVPVVDQLALIEWIETGIFERHVKKMRKIYTHRREVLVNTLTRQFGEQVTIHGVPAGMHVLASIDAGFTEREICDKALNAGVRVYPSSECFSGPIPDGPHLIFGFGMLSEEEISDGIQVFAKSIKN